MMRTHCCAAALAAAAWLGTSSAARATVFFTDGFDYADGQLTAADGSGAMGSGANVSGGNWVSHSTNANFIQVVGGKAVLDVGNGVEDVNRTFGGAMLAPGNTWYYAARFTVTPGSASTINTNLYFMHFKEAGTVQFRARLYLAPPNDPLNAFTLGLSSSSVTGGIPTVKWATDLLYDTEYTVVVSYTADDDDTNPSLTQDGFSSLWVNPVNQASTSITDTMPNANIINDLTPATQQVALAMRQNGGSTTQPKVNVDIVSAGDEFAAVLAALSPATPTNNPDFNNDGDVDGDDLLIWQQGLGQTGLAPGNKSTGDANGDGSVNGLDLQRWKDRYAMSPSAAAAAAAVPEPGAAALVVIAFLGMAVGRRRPERAAVVIELLNASR